MSKNRTNFFESNVRIAILKNNETQLAGCVKFDLRKNIKNWHNPEEKNKSFSKSITFYQKLIFDEVIFTEHLKKDIKPIFIIEKVMKDFINEELKDKFIPKDYFLLINSLFNLCKTLDSEKKKEFIKGVYELFKENSSKFILKFFNELFEILIFSKIEQNEKVKNQGENLNKLLKKNLEEKNDIFDFGKVEHLILEQTKFDHPILTEFLAGWINLIISLSLKQNHFGKVFYDLMPWLIKTKNVGDSGESLIIKNCEQNMKNEFLNYFDNKDKNTEQIKNCILSFVKLVCKQKEINQPKEYKYLNDIILKITNHNILLQEIFPFEVFNNFLLLIIQSKDINENLDELNNNLKILIENEEYYNFEKDEFRKTIEKGIDNPNFTQKIISLDWYIFIYEKNKEILSNEEPNKEIKEIINIILKEIEKNIEEKNNENLFLLMIEKLCTDNILIVFDLLSDYILSEKLSYIFKYKIVGYLHNFLIFSLRAKDFKEYLITPITKKEKNDNDLFLFEKLFKIYAVNPMCLLVFCIYLELYELSWELILNYKNIKLEDDYYKYLASFVQAINNKQWNDIKMRFLFPNKNIYFIKCLYGILMLLPQGKAFDILSDRLYSLKGLFKCRDNFDSCKIEENFNNKEYIKKYIKIFINENKNNLK